MQDIKYLKQDKKIDWKNTKNNHKYKIILLVIQKKGINAMIILKREIGITRNSKRGNWNYTEF